MKKLLVAGLVASVLACSGTKEATRIPKAEILDFVETITTEGLRADLSVIAHDSLEGRDTGSRGLEKAARYLSGRYKALGLKPVGDNGTYEQHFNVISPITNSIEYTVTDNNGGVVSRSKVTASQIGSFSHLFGGSGELSGDIVFAGMGVTDPENGINHYPDDLAGKWVLLFVVPELSSLRSLLQNVGSKGANGVILIQTTDEQEYNEVAKSAQYSLGRPGGMTLAYLQQSNTSPQSGFISLDAVSPKLAARLLGLNSANDLRALSDSIKNDLAGFTPRALDYSLTSVTDKEDKVITTSNVVAFLEGSDPKLKNEVVVLSSHYDHVGITAPDSTGDTINNGADDDGSGTVGVLNAAQAMMAAKKAGVGPRRSVLFLHVAGEEKGLLGSRYYSDHPIFPIENTVANINVDMIGRVDEFHLENKDFVYIIGGELISSGLNTMIKEANERTVNIRLSDRFNDLNDPNQFYRRSDHWNFGRLGVPFVFFFNGVHEDYHRPSDEIEKIEWGPFTKRAKLLFASTVEIANADERPVVDNQAFINATKALPRQ